MFVGWDWASTTHDVTVLDEAGAVVDRWALRHTEQDPVGALDRLADLSEPAALPVTIERTSGLVVERLLAAGHPVVPVHPTALWAAGPRWGASGGQVRSRRQRQAGRLPAHRRAPAAPAGPPTRASKSCRPGAAG